MIKTNTTLSASLSVYIGQGEAGKGSSIAEAPAPAGYSDVYDNEGFSKVSWHCPSSAITVYISNKLIPSQESDDDWFEAGSGNFVHIEYPFKWFRVKGVDDTKIVYVQRYSHKL